jgi:hypothetical protein
MTSESRAGEVTIQDLRRWVAKAGVILPTTFARRLRCYITKRDP